MLGDTFRTLLLSGGDHLNTTTEPSWRELLPTMSTAMILSITHEDLLTHVDKLADNVVLNITDLSTVTLDRLSGLNDIIKDSVIIGTNPPTVDAIAKLGGSRKRLLFGLQRLAKLLPASIEDPTICDIPNCKALWSSIKNLRTLAKNKEVNIHATGKCIEQYILDSLLFLFSNSKKITPTRAALLIYTLADICRTLQAIYRYDPALTSQPISLINQHLSHLETVAHAYLALFRGQLDCGVAALGAMESYCNCLESSQGSIMLLTTPPYAFFQRKKNVFDYSPERILKPLPEHAAAFNLHYIVLGMHYAAFSGHTFLVDTPLFINPDTKQIGMVADYANSRLKSLHSNHIIDHLTFLSRVYFQEDIVTRLPGALSDLQGERCYFKEKPQVLDLLNCLAKSASLYEMTPLSLITDNSSESKNHQSVQTRERKRMCYEHRQYTLELFVKLLTMIHSRRCVLRQEIDSLDHFATILVHHIQKCIEQDIVDIEMRAMKLFALSCMEKSSIDPKRVHDEWQQFAMITMQVPFTSTDQLILRRIVSPLLSGLADFENKALMYSILLAPSALWRLLDHYNKICFDISVGWISGLQSAFEVFDERLANGDTQLPNYAVSILKLTKHEINKVNLHEVIFQASKVFRDQLKARTESVLYRSCELLTNKPSFSILRNPEICVYFFSALSPLLSKYKSVAEYFTNALIARCESSSRNLRDCHWITYWQHTLLPICSGEQITNTSNAVASCFKRLLEGSSPKEILFWIKDIKQVIASTKDDQYYHRLCSLHARCGCPNKVLSSVLKKAILATPHNDEMHEAEAKPSVGAYKR